MIFAGNSFIYRGKNDSVYCFKLAEKADKERIRNGFKMLSQKSIYNRFLGYVKELPDQYLDEITTIDPKKNITWGAFDISHADNLGVAVGRYKRSAEDQNGAEIAITVLDGYQNQGIGTILHATLYYVARHTGIKYFTGVALADNWKLLQRFIHLGSQVQRRGGMEYSIYQPIFEDFNQLPENEYADRFKKILRDLEDQQLCL